MKNNLREIRERLGLNQDDFAAIINKSRVHVSRMENKKLPPNFKTISEIVEGINKHYKSKKVTLEDFYEHDKNALKAKDTQEIAMLELMRMMSDTDQQRFLQMGEAFVRTDNPKKSKQ